MVEDHIVPFIRQWRVGCGLLSEQGADKCCEYDWCAQVDRFHQVTLAIRQLEINYDHTYLLGPNMYTTVYRS